MKLRFKKRKSLETTLEEWFDTLKVARRNRQLDKIEKIEKWHDKYAWYPMRTTTNDDSIEFAWFEKVRQKYDACRKESQIFTWHVIGKELLERHTHKDFFKKKLSGEIENGDDFVEMSHDGTNATINVTNTKPGSIVYVKTRDKNDHTSVWG